jgi:hypothetical protein
MTDGKPKYLCANYSTKAGEKQMDSPCMTLLETTKALHLDISTLMAWIQRGDCPFGTYVKKGGKTRGHYIIIRKRFEKYMSAEDMITSIAS